MRNDDWKEILYFIRGNLIFKRSSQSQRTWTDNVKIVPLNIEMPKDGFALLIGQMMPICRNGFMPRGRIHPFGWAVEQSRCCPFRSNDGAFENCGKWIGRTILTIGVHHQKCKSNSIIIEKGAFWFTFTFRYRLLILSTLIFDDERILVFSAIKLRKIRMFFFIFIW